MKWTVLSDNRSRSTSGRLQGKNDNRLSTEHGLSVFLETERYRILLDTGASDVFVRNATVLGIDLSIVDYVFISHGHSDHAGGLRHFLEQNRQAKVIVSPDAMSGKFFSNRKASKLERYSKRGNLHSITTVWPESIKDRLITVEKGGACDVLALQATRGRADNIVGGHPCEIADGLFVIAHIPQIHPVPKGNKNLFVEGANGEYVMDDKVKSSPDIRLSLHHSGWLLCWLFGTEMRQKSRHSEQGISYNPCSKKSKMPLMRMPSSFKDLPHRRMPVTIFIIPLPSAEMSS